MKRIEVKQHASMAVKIALRAAVVATCVSVCLGASAQQASAGNGNGSNDGAAASMVKPPQAPASGASAHNPDNMPIKRPDQSTNDRMMHAPPPASAAIAK
jgi:hypothetical protein